MRSTTWPVSGTTRGENSRYPEGFLSLTCSDTCSFLQSYGARPLARSIQTELLNPLSKYILDDSIRDGETANSESSFSLFGDFRLAYSFPPVVLDAKANRLVVVPNHEATPGMDVDSDDGYDDIEVEEVDD